MRDERRRRSRECLTMMMSLSPAVRIALSRNSAAAVALNRYEPSAASILTPKKSSEQPWRPFHQVRSLATVKEEKLAKKERRRELWESAQKRLERLQTRRDGRDLGVKKNAFREWFDKRRIFQEMMDRKARQAKLDWSIQAAAILERLPVITPDQPQWEVDYHNVKAHLAQFGKEYPPELGFSPKPNTRVAVTNEELLAMLPEGFTPAPRVTEDDKNGNVKTLNRRLATRVYLAIKQDGKWALPTVDVKDGETLLDATKRAVVDAAGDRLELYCPSNCPMGVDMTIYSDDEHKRYGTFGIKRFFLRVQYDDGDVSDISSDGRDYAWLDRDEMTQRAKDEQGEYASKFYHYLL